MRIGFFGSSYPSPPPSVQAMIVHRLGLTKVEYRKQWVNDEVLRERLARNHAQDAAGKEK